MDVCEWLRLLLSLLLLCFHLTDASIQEAKPEQQTPPQPQFNYTFARLAMEYAAASYAADPKPCLWRQNASLIMQLELPCDAVRDKCWAIIANAPSMIVVAFQGTNSKLQLFAKLFETITSPKHDIQNVGSVERYFYVALKSIAQPLAEKLNKLRETYPDKHLLFTGHSLGGALASLAATLYTLQYSVPADQVSLVTFGQPRVGNHAYAQTVDRVIPNAWRMVHRYDAVAHIPFCPGLVSCDNIFNHSPYHHGTEVWFPGNMSRHDEYRVCTGTPLDEDRNCSNRHFLRFNIDDHLYYFDREVSWHGQAGCPDEPAPPPPTPASTGYGGSYDILTERRLMALAKERALRHRNQAILNNRVQ